MTALSLFIQSKPAAVVEQDYALHRIKLLLERSCDIKQVFFYYEGVWHAQTPYAEKWRQLLPQTSFMVCSQYAEQYGILTLPLNFALQGLVDFFAKHWQLQSQLVQL